MILYVSISIVRDNLSLSQVKKKHIQMRLQEVITYKLSSIYFFSLLMMMTQKSIIIWDIVRSSISFLYVQNVCLLFRFRDVIWIMASLTIYSYYILNLSIIAKIKINKLWSEIHAVGRVTSNYIYRNCNKKLHFCIYCV